MRPIGRVYDLKADEARQRAELHNRITRRIQAAIQRTDPDDLDFLNQLYPEIVAAVYARYERNNMANQTNQTQTTVAVEPEPFEGILKGSGLGVELASPPAVIATSRPADQAGITFVESDLQARPLTEAERWERGLSIGEELAERLLREAKARKAAQATQPRRLIAIKLASSALMDLLTGRATLVPLLPADAMLVGTMGNLTAPATFVTLIVEHPSFAPVGSSRDIQLFDIRDDDDRRILAKLRG